MRKDKEARRLYAQAIDIRREVLGPDHPDLAVSLNDLAVMHVREGEHDRAEPLYRQVSQPRLMSFFVFFLSNTCVSVAQALAIRIKALGNDHIDTAASKANLGLLCQDLKRFSESKGLMEVQYVWGAA
jgi:hypothetical protein